ncbi:MAG: prepilin-type N-terminal cleavage/methylation domain-containing protein [Promethearchaeota archaeon]
MSIGTGIVGSRNPIRFKEEAMRIRLKNQKGFTLMEVMIAVIILSVALLALAGLQIVSIRGNSFGGTMTEAITLARDKIEDLKASDWDNVVAGNDTPVVMYTSYARNWTVVQGIGNTREVTVTVSWDNGNHQISMATILAEY